MKKALAILLVYSILMTLLVVSPFTANADEKSIAETGATSGTTGDCTWKIEGTKLTISGNGKMGNYGLGPTPWSSSSITEAVIDDGVTTIGTGSFYHCRSLEKATIPYSVTGIGSNAFRYSGLKSIDIPDSVIIIGESAFSFCTNLTSIDIPNSVTSIGKSAFNYCKGLANVEISDSVTYIDTDTFRDCTNLTSIYIPNSITAIDDYAFYGCDMLKSVTIPASVRYINSLSFGYYGYEDYGMYVKVSGFTVYGYKGSEAERYANNNNFKFIALDDEPSDPTKTTDREIFGDIDGDGVITIVDTTFLQRYTIDVATPYPIGEKMK